MEKKQLEEPIYGEGEKIKKYYNKVKSEIIYAFDILFNRPTKKQRNREIKSLTERLYKEDEKN